MSEIVKTIKVPFQKIDFKASFTKKESMNELESLIMILITNSDELGLKKETLREAIAVKYGVHNHTIPLIKIALESLTNSKTIQLNIDEDLDSLLDKNIRRIKVKIDKEIVEDIQAGDFYKKSLKVRKIFNSLYESVVPGTEVPKTIKELKYDEAWSANAVEEASILAIAHDEAMSAKEQTETLSSVDINEDDTKLVYLEDKIIFKKKGLKIYGTNILFKTVFKAIDKNDLELDDLTSMLDTSIKDIEFSKQAGIPVENETLNIFAVNDGKYIELNNTIMKLFNKEVLYEIEELNESIKINEIYASEVSIDQFASELITNKDVGILNSFKTIKDQLKNAFLNMAITNENNEFVKYFLDKESFETQIGDKANVFIAVYDELDARTIFKNFGKKTLEKHINLINSFIVKSKYSSLYDVVYGFVSTQYGENTKLFPEWDKEQYHYSFIKDLDKINSKIGLIDCKKDAEDVLEFILQYNFAPIKSRVFEELQYSIKKMIPTLAFTPSQELSLKGMQIRIMLEKLIDKTQSSAIFIDVLNKRIKDKKIASGDKSKVMEIYKRANSFHHNSDLVFDSKLESKIKQDIISIYKIADKNKIDLTQYKGELKWATA